MSPTRVDEPVEPITLDLAAAFSLEHGPGRADLLQLGPQLDQARRTLLAGAECEFRRPQQLLDAYRIGRHRSTLAQILSAAKKFRELVDRAVILAPPNLIAPAQMLLAACCHPHHNDQSRGQRGGRPRIFFAPAVPDNDAMQGLLDILPHGRLLHSIDERWGIVAVEDKHCNLSAALFALFWDLLQSTVEAHDESQFAIAVGGGESALMQFAEQAGCQRITSCESAAAMFHPGVLLAGSVMGIDVVKLLQGGAMMAERFETAPPGDNPALDLAGLRYLLSKRRGIRHAAIVSSDAALRPLEEWSDPFDPSAQHLLIQVIPQALRRDRLRVTMRSEGAPPEDKKRVAPSLSELADARWQSLQNARVAVSQPSAIVRLPRIDESTVGQLAQLFFIANSIQHDLMTS